MQWEYETIVIKGNIQSEKLKQALNDLGKEGWELVNIIPQISSDSDMAFGDVDLNISCCEAVYVDYNVAVLKRKISE